MWDFEDFDIQQITGGADESSPLGDVSNSSQPMETWTPAGNGTGEFLDHSAQESIFGGLSKALDYAMKRDAYQIGMREQPQFYGRPTTQQQVMAQGKQTNFMFLALCGLGVYLVLKA